MVGCRPPRAQAAPDDRLDRLVAGGVVLDVGEGVAVVGQEAEVGAVPAGGAVAAPGVLGDVGLTRRQHEGEGGYLRPPLVGVADQIGQPLAASEA